MCLCLFSDSETRCRCPSSDFPRRKTLGKQIWIHGEQQLLKTQIREAECKRAKIREKDASEHRLAYYSDTVKLTEQELAATGGKVSPDTEAQEGGRTRGCQGAPGSVGRQTDWTQTGTRAFLWLPWAGTGEAGTLPLGLSSLHVPAGSKAAQLSLATWDLSFG